MNKRKFKSDPQALLEEGTKIISNNDDYKFIYKVTLVNLMLNGMLASELCKSCKESVRTLTSWMKAVDEEGFESLRPKKQSGRPSKLTDDQKANIKVAIAGDPQAFGYNIWDGPTLSDHILKTYNVSLGVRQCERLFSELGFSLIRPQTFPSKNKEDAPEREELKKNRQYSPR